MTDVFGKTLKGINLGSNQETKPKPEETKPEIKVETEEKVAIKSSNYSRLKEEFRNYKFRESLYKSVLKVIKVNSEGKLEVTPGLPMSENVGNFLKNLRLISKRETSLTLKESVNLYFKCFISDDSENINHLVIYVAANIFIRNTSQQYVEKRKGEFNISRIEEFEKGVSERRERDVNEGILKGIAWSLIFPMGE